MKFFALLLLLQLTFVAGFSQIPPFPSGSAILPYTNLNIRWQTAKHPWPKTLWTYQMAPTKFSSTLISNLMSLGNFTEKDRWGSWTNTNGIAYYNYKNSLRISFATGEINYGKSSRQFSPTNLAQDVPDINQLYGLVTNYLPKLGLDNSQIAKAKDGRILMNFNEPLSGFPASGPNGDFLTNIYLRGATFGRVLDGVKCDSTVGSCTFYFGEHSQIMDIELFGETCSGTNSMPPPRRSKLSSGYAKAKLFCQKKDTSAWAAPRQ